LATYAKFRPTPDAVRFSTDGLLLAASDPTRLHVLEAATLEPIRLIEPPLEDGYRIFAVETSPIGHLVVVAANYSTSGMLFAYDLDTGRLLFQWKSPHGGEFDFVETGRNAIRSCYSVPLHPGP
jgi:hypothetical protein